MENKIDLKMPTLKELSRVEMLQTNGGWMRLVYTYFSALAAEAVYEGIEQCIADFEEGFNETYNH